MISLGSQWVRGRALGARIFWSLVRGKVVVGGWRGKEGVGSVSLGLGLILTFWRRLGRRRLLGGTWKIALWRIVSRIRWMGTNRVVPKSGKMQTWVGGRKGGISILITKKKFSMIRWDRRSPRAKISIRRINLLGLRMVSRRGIGQKMISGS